MVSEQKLGLVGAISALTNKATTLLTSFLPGGKVSLREMLLGLELGLGFTSSSEMLSLVWSCRALLSGSFGSLLAPAKFIILDSLLCVCMAVNFPACLGSSKASQRAVKSNFGQISVVPDSGEIVLPAEDVLNHRIGLTPECLGLEGALGAHPTQPLPWAGISNRSGCSGPGNPYTVQTGIFLEYFQEWDIHQFSEQPVPQLS